YQCLRRRDQMIKSRGYLVERVEMVRALTANPNVLEAVVVRLLEPQLGNRLVASIVPRTGRQQSPRELRCFCTERLPLYMVPEQIEVRIAFPRTSTGKADRQALARSWTTKEKVQQFPERS